MGWETLPGRIAAPLGLSLGMALGLACTLALDFDERGCQVDSDCQFTSRPGICVDGSCQEVADMMTSTEDEASGCLDGIIQPELGEDCEPGLPLATDRCSELGAGFTWGSVTCRDNCTFEDSECRRYECGNDEPEPGEECDFQGTLPCVELPAYVGGVYGCAECRLDLSQCARECPVTVAIWYVDCDGDGFAESDVGAQTACVAPLASLTGCGTPNAAWTTTRPAGANVDCDDLVETTYPGATEPDLCNGIDEDCDRRADDGVTVTLSVASPTNGTVTSNPGGITCGGTCSAEFPCGTEVTLETFGDEGFGFSRWDGACSVDAAACSLSMDQDRDVSVEFEGTGTRSVTVTTIGSCIVTSTPEEVNCRAPEICTNAFPFGSTVVLTTRGDRANAGNWGGDCPTVFAETCTLAMTTDHVVTVECQED